MFLTLQTKPIVFILANDKCYYFGDASYRKIICRKMFFHFLQMSCPRMLRFTEYTGKCIHFHEIWLINFCIDAENSVIKVAVILVCTN